MKKLTLCMLGIAMFALPSCMNQGENSDSSADTVKISQEEKLLSEQLKFNVKNLVESAKQLKAAPFIAKSNDGGIELTAEEKMVKPNYLFDLNSTNKLVNLSEKYRAVAILGVDKVIAEMYDMPVAGFKASIAKLVLEIDDPALKEFSKQVWESNGPVNEAISKLVDDEYAAERQRFFWEFIAAGLVEEVYVLTENMEKFMPMFDDESAANVTFNFVCVHYGLTEMIKFYPEMESLDKVLEPLYVINATNKEELHAQLTELKESIKRVRQNILL